MPEVRVVDFEGVSVEVLDRPAAGTPRCRLVFADFVTPDGLGVSAEARRAFDLFGFTADEGQLHPGVDEDGQPVLWVGLGLHRDLTGGDLGRSMAGVLRSTRLPAIAVATSWMESAVGAQVAGCELTVGAISGAYRFQPRAYDAPQPAARSILLYGDDLAGVAQGVHRGFAIGRAQSLARDLVNEPANQMTPSRIAEVAEAVAARTGMGVTIWESGDIESSGLGGLLAVTAGTAQPPRFVTLRYHGTTDKPASSKLPVIGLVGKGVTFDSGGLCLKAADPMATMKIDMCGAAAVLGAMEAISTLGTDLPVTAYLPLAENMPGGKATRPGDIAKMANGLTVEIVNTDAEGRLLLADGLSVAVKEGVSALIDIASLTGACRVSLGTAVGGVFGSDDAWVTSVLQGSAQASEQLWHLPMVDGYATELHSLVADLRNVGRPVRPNEAGAIVAALFLRRFVSNVPWAHIDMGGPAYRAQASWFSEEGATGFGVRTLLETVARAGEYFRSTSDA